MGAPIPPWEAEQAAAALAELKAANAVDEEERAAQRLAQRELLLSQVDKMILDRKNEVATLERLGAANQSILFGTWSRWRSLLFLASGRPGWLIIAFILLAAFLGFSIWLSAWATHYVGKLPVPPADSSQIPAASDLPSQ